MRIDRCSFCSGNIYPGHGTTFVRNDGKIFNFCTSKCRRNFNLRRNPRKVRWTKAYRRLHDKDLAADDRTFEFERRRNRPVRYNRELFEKCKEAMKRVWEIRRERQVRHTLLRKQAIAQRVLDAEEKRQTDKIEAVRAEDIANMFAAEANFADAPREELSVRELLEVSKDMERPSSERRRALVKLKVMKARAERATAREKASGK